MCNMAAQLSPRSCAFCHRNIANNRTGELLESPDRETTAHYNCMLFSPRVVSKASDSQDSFGGFDVQSVRREIKRAKTLKCSYCKFPGASIGCDKPTCKKTYHYMCVRKDKGRCIKEPKREIYIVLCAKHKDRQENTNNNQSLDEIETDDISDSSEDCTTGSRKKRGQKTKRRKSGATNSVRKKRKMNAPSSSEPAHNSVPRGQSESAGDEEPTPSTSRGFGARRKLVLVAAVNQDEAMQARRKELYRSITAKMAHWRESEVQEPLAIRGEEKIMRQMTDVIESSHADFVDQNKEDNMETPRTPSLTCTSTDTDTESSESLLNPTRTKSLRLFSSLHKEQLPIQDNHNDEDQEDIMVPERSSDNLNTSVGKYKNYKNFTKVLSTQGVSPHTIDIHGEQPMRNGINIATRNQETSSEEASQYIKEESNPVPVDSRACPDVTAPEAEKQMQNSRSINQQQLPLKFGDICKRFKLVFPKITVSINSETPPSDINDQASCLTQDQVPSEELQRSGLSDEPVKTERNLNTMNHSERSPGLPYSQQCDGHCLCYSRLERKLDSLLKGQEILLSLMEAQQRTYSYMF